MATFPATERLCSQRLIDDLRTHGKHFVQFPLRVQYLLQDTPTEPGAQVLIWAPKRLFKRANKRNLLRRRMREAYRLQKEPLRTSCQANNQQLLVSFLYCATEELDFAYIEKAMNKAIQKLILNTINHD